MWTENTGTGFDVTATFMGVTNPIETLYEAIHSRGWEVTKVKPTKTGYEAEAKNPANGQKVTKVGTTPETAVAALLMALTRIDFIRTRWSAHRKGAWETHWTDRLEEVAQAYAKAPVYDPKAVPAWVELAHDCKQRRVHLEDQLQIEVVDNPHPYDTPEDLFEDVTKKGHLFVTRSNARHPVWSVDQVVDFRIVHDVLGHAASGGDFSWHGENLAFSHHAPLLSPTAQKALFAEALGQAAYAAFHPGYGAQQKICFLDDVFSDDDAAKENGPVHQGIHPSQSLAPVETPSVPSKRASVRPGARYYHVSPASNRASIQAQGLIPSQPGDDDWGDNAAGVYLWPDRDVAHGFAVGSERETGESHDVWEVNHPGLTPEEDEIVPGSFYTSRPVPAASLRISPRSEWAYHRQASVPSMDELARFRASDECVFSDDAAEKNGPGHTETHPSQSLAPTETPSAPSKTSAFLDPNAGWESGYAPADRTEEPESGAAYTDWGDPLGWDRPNDDGITAKDMAHRLDSGWSHVTHPDGTPNRDMMKKAVVNAFTAVLLSPRKNLRWNAIHYQHLADLAHVSNDPNEYHRLLERNRTAWNVARKIPINAHKPYYRAERDYARYLQIRNPEWNARECTERAEYFTRVLLEDEKRKLSAKLEAKEAKLPEDKRTTTSQIEIQAAQRVKKHLEEIMNPSHNPETDFHVQDAFKIAAPHPPRQVSLKATDVDPSVTDLFNGDVNPDDMGAYSAWMGDHLKSIAAVSKRADEILDAALKDVHDHDGAGHHFRAAVLNMDLPGVGPKVTSFAWLLLQPLTSQLATIDSHMLDVLGYEPEDMNRRDYFRMERELQARRDAAGYSHVPLGPFQWAMWDYKRSGPDQHQDHSAFRVLSPLDHNHVDWNARANAPKRKKWKTAAPPWWKATDAAAEEVAQHFNDTIGLAYPKHTYPFREKPAYAVTASEHPANELHVSWGLPANIRNVISNWTLTQEWPEGTKFEDPDDYHVTALYAESGWENEEFHAFVKAHKSEGVPFEAIDVREFGDGDEKAIVIYLKSPQAKEQAERLMDKAEELGLEPNRHDGYKAHVTVAYGPGKPKGADIKLSFRGTELLVSRPRGLREQEGADREFLSGLASRSPYFDHEDGTSDVGAPGMTIMQHLREYYPLSTEELWAMPGVEVGKVA